MLYGNQHATKDNTAIRAVLAANKSSLIKLDTLLVLKLLRRLVIICAKDTVLERRLGGCGMYALTSYP
jgi:hypothetical protein